MPWVAKALLLALKTKRGRELLLAGAVGAVEMARSEQARRLYATGELQGRKALRFVRDAAGSR